MAMRMLRILLFSSVSAATWCLCACAVGPDYRSPALPATTAFRNANELQTRTTRPVASFDHWWESFGDPELSRLVERAMSQNLDLAQAEARMLQARAQAQAARAALLPAGQLVLQPEGTHQSLNSPLPRIETAFPGFERNQGLYDANVTVSWEVDLFGGLRRSAQAALANYQSSEAARAGAWLTVSAQVADAYVLIRTLQARVAVAQEHVDAQRQLVSIIELQFGRGLVARLRLDQSRGALAGVEAALPVLQAGLEAEINRLEVLLAADSGSLHAELAGPADIPTAPAIDAAGGPASLIRRRPDLIAAERTLAASSARIGAAVSDYYPKININALIGFESIDSSVLFSSASFQPQGMGVLRWRLFDFGRVDAEVASARGAEAQALAAYKQSVLQATADVESALDAVVKREAQARILMSGEAALSDAQGAALAAFQAGQVSLLDVLDADDRLLQTRDQRVLAQSEAARAAITSFKALGGGWAHTEPGSK